MAEPGAAMTQTLSFAPDGRRVYATYFTNSSSAGLVAIDLNGAVHVLARPDGRWLANPRVSPDGHTMAITMRSRQTSIGLLEHGASATPAASR
jgi:hypothetical protein